MKKTYFGNGVFVSDTGALLIEFRRHAQMGLQVAKSFKESLEEAIAFAERLSGVGAPAESIAPSVRRSHALN